jgi:hypothetical protein
LENPKERPRRISLEMAQRSARRSVEGNAGKESMFTTELAEDHKKIVRQLDLLKATPKLVEGNSKLTFICLRLQQMFAQH